MKRGMPINSFRRPKLQSEYEVKQALRLIPEEYWQSFNSFLNPYQIYAAIELYKIPTKKTNPYLMKNLLSNYPLYFYFSKLSKADESAWFKLCRYFSPSTIMNFFSNANEHIGVPNVKEFERNDNTDRLIQGIQQLSYVIQEQKRIRNLFSEIYRKSDNLLKELKMYAVEIQKRYSLNDLDLEEVSYLFGKPTKGELSRIFFDLPNYFVGVEYCENCNHALKNWISVTAKFGPSCGKHGYNPLLVGLSRQQFSSRVQELIESKFNLLKAVPLTPESDLVKYRKARVGFPFHILRKSEREVFSDAKLREALSDRESDDWKLYVDFRVGSEFK